jgi:hypothetical protein
MTFPVKSVLMSRLLGIVEVVELETWKNKHKWSHGEFNISKPP